MAAKKKTKRRKIGSFDYVLEKLEQRNGYPATQYNKDIFNWVAKGNGNAIVDAKAGSGKTSTLIDALEFIDKSKSVILVAFNKHIATELNDRNLPINANARTLHSFGMRCVRQNFGGFLKVKERKNEFILRDLMGYNELGDNDRKRFWRVCIPICHMVSLMKSHGYGIVYDDAEREDVEDLSEKYNIEIPLNGDEELFWEMLFDVYNISLEHKRIIDFDDMLAYPLYHEMAIPTFDFVFVDESQDLNPIQVEMIYYMIGKKGRAVFVGDPNQAIYGFRGADPDAMKNITREFQTRRLPLSICWRCPKSVVAEAQEIVQDIEPAPNASEGIVRDVEPENLILELDEDDYVLCRCTAPLVAECLSAIRNGIKATVMGRDIGKGLIDLLRRIVKFSDGDLYDAIERYGDIELPKLEKPGKEAQYQDLQDRLDTLKILSEGLTHAREVESRINEIFSDDKRGVTFCTVHRSKGLEANRIFIIQPELMPHPMAEQAWQVEQEMNLKYVAITRAKRELIWVRPKVDESKESEENNVDAAHAGTVDGSL